MQVSQHAGGSVYQRVDVVRADRALGPLLHQTWHYIPGRSAIAGPPDHIIRHPVFRPDWLYDGKNTDEFHRGSARKVGEKLPTLNLQLPRTRYRPVLSVSGKKDSSPLHDHHAKPSHILVAIAVE